jgi:hypothetical protein
MAKSELLELSEYSDSQINLGSIEYRNQGGHSQNTQGVFWDWNSLDRFVRYSERIQSAAFF